MDNLFREAVAFNGDVSDWDTGSVTRMDNVFYDATVFDQDIGGWDVRNVTTMANMFFRSATDLQSGYLRMGNR